MSIGNTCWVIPGGHIPLESHGDEPDFTSRDVLCVLNPQEEDAEIELTIYYTDRDPVGPYQLKVKAQRVRHIRFNDLIDPEAVILDTDFSCVVMSSIPVVVQFSRIDTSSADHSWCSTMAFAIDE